MAYSIEKTENGFVIKQTKPKASEQVCEFGKAVAGVTASNEKLTSEATMEGETLVIYTRKEANKASGKCTRHERSVKDGVMTYTMSPRDKDDKEVKGGLCTRTLLKK